MHPTILKDKEKVEKLRTELGEKYKRRVSSYGKVVSYSHPILPDPFPKLLAIGNSERRKDFFHQYYFIHTRKKYIENLMPVSEYYKVVSMNVSQKLFDLDTAIASANQFAGEIKEIFQKNHIIRENTGQPFVPLQRQTQQLKQALAAYLFTSRSLFDCIATLLQFLYGADSKYFDSFSDFLKDLKAGRVKDHDFSKFVEENMAWFFRLRNLRDYVTHFGSLDISLYELPSGELNLRVQDEYEMVELLNSSSSGIRKFMDFFDTHFSGPIR